MAEYGKLARQLAAVRRAWKRTAALSGLAVTCLETLGVLTVAFLIDWIYRPLPTVRLCIFAGVLAGVVALLVRHVARPLMRRISDDQVAMFVEEHNDQFEGSLITATEFGRPSARNSAQAPAYFIDAVIDSAIRRAQQINVRSILDFRRLRKYGLAALAVLAGYGVLCVAVPDMGRHAGRVLIPWRTGADDRAAILRAAGLKAPVTFELSKNNADIQRGSTFEVEAVLSRHSDDPVSLNFRPASDAQGNWRTVPMAEMDKLNAFKGALADVTEDMEYFVAAGAFRTEVYKIGVYDPLAVTGLEVRTRYPAYLQLPDKAENFPDNSAVDIAAPEGSKIVLRITANRPLTAGRITLTGLDSHSEQIAAPPTAQAKTSCVGEFTVSYDETYEYEIGDAIGQKASGASRAYVRALRDGPPSLEVKYPLSTGTPIAIGEVTFDVSAVDDLALAGVEVIYERQSPSSPGGAISKQPGRMALELERTSAGGFPDKARATGRLMLEDLQPACVPEEIISYYIECTDRKGQKAAGDIQMIAVQHYENWPAISAAPPHEPTFLIMKDIEEYVKASWKIHQARAALTKAELTRQCTDLADSMYDGETKSMYPFYNIKKIPADKKPHALKADEFILSGHKALKDLDTAKAVSDFRTAMAELQICGIGDSIALPILTADFGKVGNQKEKDLGKLLSKITVEVPKVDIPQEYMDKIKAAEKIMKAAGELEKKQADIAKKADDIAKNAAGGKDGNNKDKPTNDAQAGKLAGEQDKLATEARSQADQSRADPKADAESRRMAGQLDQAAREMKDAGKNLNEGKLEEGAAAAERARRELQKLAQGAEEMRQEKLAGAIAQTEAQAGKILNRQRELTKETEAATDNAANAPDDQDKEFEKLAFKQAQLKTDMEGVKEAVQELQKWAQNEAKPETQKQVEESNRQVARGQVEQKMANAVVELAARQGQEAQKEQRKAETELAKVVESLRKASDSLASDTEAELRRAVAEAGRIDEGLKKLGVKEPQTQPVAGAGTQPATTVAQSRPGNQPGPSTQQVAQRPGEANDKPKTQPASEAQDNMPLTDREKKDLAENLAYDLERFAAHLENRNFAQKSDTDFLSGQTRDVTALTGDLQNDSPRRTELGAVVRRVKNKLEDEYQAQLDSKRLMAAQREDCPPAYRHLVNKYYEALSQVKK